MTAPIRSRRPREGRGKRPCGRRSALGIKLTALLLFVALLLLALLAALVRGLV
jgi:hypothetical protein